MEQEVFDYIKNFANSYFGSIYEHTEPLLPIINITINISNQCDFIKTKTILKAPITK